jgi:membrane protease YdiL (CAAX protease family)
MNKFKIKLWLSLTIIGFIGIASLLLSELPLNNIPEKVTQRISPEKLKLLILINPAIMVAFATVIGTLLYDKVKFSVPVLERLLNKPDSPHFNLPDIAKQGVILGVLAGALIVITGKLFQPYLPQALTDATNDMNLSIATKLLYGGITEELLTRFGFMSFVVWLLFKVFRQLNAAVYWTGILISAMLFALGHLPIVFSGSGGTHLIGICLYHSGKQHRGLHFRICLLEKRSGVCLHSTRFCAYYHGVISIFLLAGVGVVSNICYLKAATITCLVIVWRICLHLQAVDGRPEGWQTQSPKPLTFIRLRCSLHRFTA